LALGGRPKRTENSTETQLGSIQTGGWPENPTLRVWRGVVLTPNVVLWRRERCEAVGGPIRPAARLELPAARQELIGHCDDVLANRNRHRPISQDWRCSIRVAICESRVSTAEDRYCGYIGRTCLHDGSAAQPPVRESFLEGRPATLKRAQCVFSESTLFWKILVTRVKRIQQ
jgi:hypothetical protein